MSYLERSFPTLVAVAILFGVAAASAGQVAAGETALDSRGSNIVGTVTDRDNTRVNGTVFDPRGKPLSKVEIWVANDLLLTSRLRFRTMGNGDYRVRNLGRIYTQEDVLGILLRLSFDREGYQPFSALAAVERNGAAELHPILWPDGESPAPAGWCAFVQGRVTNAEGKGVKKATVTLTSAAGSDMLVQTLTAKNGSYRALLWNAPASLIVSANAPGFNAGQEPLVLEGTPRTDMVATVTLDLVLRR